MGLLFREHPKAQPEGGFRFHSFDRVFRFKILIQPDVDTSYLSKILLLYGAKTNKTLV